MHDCQIEIPKKQLKKIISIIKTDDFRKINAIVNICDLNQSEDKIIKNIKDYIWVFLSNYSFSSFFTDVDYFIAFIEDYGNEKKTLFTLPSREGVPLDLKNNLLEICNGYHIHNDCRYLKLYHVNGLYMNGAYLGSDHKVYLSKKSMKSRSLPVSSEMRNEVDYNSLLAQCVFNYFSQPVAEYYLVKDNCSPFNLLLTPSFLKDNQELIHIRDLLPEDSDSFIDTHTNRLNIIKNSIIIRYKEKMNDNDFQNLIKKIELQYCIQSFMKLLIGPMDANLGNTAIVLTHNNSIIPSIDISPAYDLDISFNIAEELVNNNNMDQIEDLEGNPSTIKSIITEFKDIPGFRQFLDDVVEKILSHNISEEVLDIAYKKTNFEFFKMKKENYVNFLNRRFIKVIKTYKSVFLKEKVDETILGRSGKK